MNKIEKIKAEIERQRGFIEGLFIEGDNSFYDGQDDAYNQLLAFIDSLPEEKPSEDLEEAAEIYCHDMGLDAEDNGTAWEETKDDFIAGAKWMKERMIKDAAEVITVQRSLTEPEFVKQRVIFLKEG